MLNELENIKEKYNKLTLSLSDPSFISDPKKFRKIAKERADLEPLVKKYERFQKILGDIRDFEEIIASPDAEEELKQMAQQEWELLKDEEEKVINDLKILLLPKDPNDEKDVIMEIRAGAGGEEAALFAGDLFRMYSRYAEFRNWKTEVLSQSATGMGGFKEIIVLITGQWVYSRLKYESGVHRVQRVPETEAQGRIHTSAVTVAVLPEAEEIDIEIDPEDLRIDVYRSTGHGGQHVNTTDSAVRITHQPTGLVVTCQDEKSQHKNKAKAMKVLRSRLLDMEQAEQHSKISEERRNMVGSGDRSERIRTYNFPQGRMTDHRIGLTLYKLESILQGDLDCVIDPLITHYQTEALKKTDSSET